MTYRIIRCSFRSSPKRPGPHPPGREPPVEVVARGGAVLRQRTHEHVDPAVDVVILPGGCAPVGKPDRIDAWNGGRRRGSTSAGRSMLVARRLIRPVARHRAG